ncbi:acyl-CoA dehydrogenase family protein [Sinomonas sp. ASV486]|uniref:acyl-CoA dehydrogenase family protein n=1 Tax=Sinomonas sp. ASV486 TaxID=3051170 RepID=UPI0027DC10C4|nr:acyl-CoA dehydrogenase family protein [Sinomonas sp. ASV486]MDQ4489122.1 acyl-CoA dehydrogenase family protein [Sinomonas sp. ASV486]
MTTDIGPAAASAPSTTAGPVTSAPSPAGPLPAEPARKPSGPEESRAVMEASRQTEWERPSFAKALYLGDFQWDLIHPVPESSAGDVERGDAFLRSLEELARTMDGSRIEAEDRIPDEYLRSLADIGAFGMKIPVEYGGLGLPLAYYGRALMLLGSVHPSIGALLSAHQSIGVPEPVKMFGSAEQKQEFLPRCAAGAVTAFLLTEPDVGSDPARLTTTAQLSEDGQSYILNGSKLWTTNGVIAELVVIMAKVLPHEAAGAAPDTVPAGKGGITAFVVEMDSPGITVENRNSFMGLKGLENGVTRFDGVRVPAANRVGREGQGLKIALTTLNTGRLSIPALCAGGGKWSLKIAREWSAARVQWGQPIGEHEAVASKIAFIAATSFALEAVFEVYAATAEAGMKDVRIEAALAKLWTSEMSYTIADELLQIRGGRGYETAESLRARGERAVPAEQLVRDLRINRIFEGSTEIMRLLIAREAVDAHLAAAGDLARADATFAEKARAAKDASGFYAKWLPKLLAGEGNDPRAYREFGALGKHLRYIERASRRLARHTFAGMGRWQAALERRQVFLGRIVDIGAELFAMAAACSWSEHLRIVGADGADTARDLAEAFCEQSRRRVEALFNALWDNTDDADRHLARRVLAGEFTWLEAGVLDPSEGTGPWIAPRPEGHSTKADLRRKVS